MSTVGLRSAVATLPLLALAIGAPGAAHAGGQGPAAAPAGPAAAGERQAAPRVGLLAGPGSSRTTVLADRSTSGTAAATTAAGARFTVTYSGFTPAARIAFQRAVDVWAGALQSNVPITVRASFTPLERGVLGSAGASGIYKNFPGAPAKDTWYVDAIANNRAGRQVAASPDIVAEFNSDFGNWHYGSAAAPRGTYDFTSVVLHELGHGLGFLGAGRVADGVGSVRTSGLPISYDRFTENYAGKALLAFPNRSSALRSELTGGRVYFDSPAVRSANDAKRAKLYAPSSWEPGSSYSHLDEANYPAGSTNSLMTPVLRDGETVRVPGPLTKAIFRSIGW